MIRPNSRSFNNGNPLSHARVVFSLLVLGWPGLLPAGEIAGLPSNTPPIFEKPIEFSFSNDLLGRGGSVDDFRTQQFIISGTVGERWELTLDHSILTQVDADEPGRVDQLSATLGYRVINNVTDTVVTRLTMGLGLRGYGDFGGERMQNGAHQLVRNSVEIVPYVDVERTDGVAWVDAQHFAWLKGTKDPADWRWGYWLRGSALWASDGQVDAAAGAYAVAGKGSVDFWAGLRQDWRSGYEDPVLAETALAEEDLAAVLGFRWGPVVFETVQQFDNRASYGQVRLLARGFGEHRNDSRQSPLTFGVEFLVPDVHLNLRGRWRAAWLNRSAGLSKSLFFVAGYGEPQHDDDPMIYRRSVQVAAGVEWEKHLDAADGWASVYGSAGLGWRQERIFGDDARAGQRSDTVSRGIVTGGVGVRFNGSELIRDYNFRIQLGLTAWIPFNDARLDMEGESFRVQQPAIAVVLGLTLGRF